MPGWSMMLMLFSGLTPTGKCPLDSDITIHMDFLAINLCFPEEYFCMQSVFEQLLEDYVMTVNNTHLPAILCVRLLCILLKKCSRWQCWLRGRRVCCFEYLVELSLFIFSCYAERSNRVFLVMKKKKVIILTE